MASLRPDFILNKIKSAHLLYLLNAKSLRKWWKMWNREVMATGTVFPDFPESEDPRIDID